MTTSLLFSGNAGAVAEPAASPPITEEISAVLDVVEEPVLEVVEEANTQEDFPYSYQFWKAALAKIDATRANRGR